MLKSRQLVIEIWLEHINKNHAVILTLFFNHWVGFTKKIVLRSDLITITDRDIWITDKIFREIKESQRKMLV